jgi:hypothetical protein
MSFFDVLGKIVNPKNILTAFGALSPLGPVAGGALGRGIGGAIDQDENDSFLGNAMGGAALGGMGSFAAGALGGGAGAAAPTSASAGGPVALPTSAVSTAAAAPAQAGGGFGSGFWGGLSSAEKAGLVGQGLGSAANVYSAYEMGRLEDEREQRRRRLDRELAPLLAKTLREMGG